jgi:LmbE family N-acetylglucosaminyl deacetylase
LVGVIDGSWSPEEATLKLRDDQSRAGSHIGVKGQYWLGYPDAGQYNYYDVRNDMIKCIRMVKPDVIFTMDPWMLYEAHRDHVLASQAAAEAAILYDFVRIKTDPEIDQNYHGHQVNAVVFHATSYPNTIYDISSTIIKKNEAILSYKAQFFEEDLPRLVSRTEMYAQHIARNEDFEYGEAIKIIPPGLLHGVGEAYKF